MIAATGEEAESCLALEFVTRALDLLFHCAELAVHTLLPAPHLLHVAEHFADLVRAQPDVLLFNI